MEKEDLIARAHEAKQRIAWEESQLAADSAQDSGGGSGDEWQRGFDEDSGCYYYEHAVTGEVTWEEGGDDAPPPENGSEANSGGVEAVWEEDAAADVGQAEGQEGAESSGQWEEKYDDESGFPYYENMSSGEVVWQKPEDWDENGGAVEGVDEEAAEETVRGVGDAAWVSNFEEKWDTEAGYPYFENKVTGEILWKKPVAWASAESAVGAEGAAAAAAGQHSPTSQRRHTLPDLPQTSRGSGSSDDQTSNLKLPPIKSVNFQNPRPIFTEKTTHLDLPQQNHCASPPDKYEVD